MAEPEYQESLPSVGDTLKSLREQKNFGIADIANNLHLDIRVIEALEQDNYEKLPDPIYVRGYIRNYSKFVDGDANALVALYDKKEVAREPEIIPEIKHSSQTNTSDKPVKAFTYLLTLVLVILLIAWWQDNFVVRKPRQVPLTDVNETAIPDALPEVLPLQDERGLNSIETPLIAAGLEKTDPELPIQPSYIDQAENDASTVDETIPTANGSGVDADNEQTNSKFTSEGSGPDTINLRLTADSWIEIVDANNNKVFFNLGRRGDTYELHGTAPFSVLLGFPQGVNVEFNDSFFDPALYSYSRSGIARFTLDE